MAAFRRSWGSARRSWRPRSPSASWPRLSSGFDRRACTPARDIAYTPAFRARRPGVHVVLHHRGRDRAASSLGTRARRPASKAERHHLLSGEQVGDAAGRIVAAHLTDELRAVTRPPHVDEEPVVAELSRGSTAIAQPNRLRAVDPAAARLLNRGELIGPRTPEGGAEERIAARGPVQVGHLLGRQIKHVGNGLPAERAARAPHEYFLLAAKLRARCRAHER